MKIDHQHRGLWLVMAWILVTCFVGCSHQEAIPGATRSTTPEEALALEAASEVSAVDTWTIETLRSAEPVIMTAREFSAQRKDHFEYEQKLIGKPVQVSGRVFNLGSSSAELYSKRADAKGKFLSNLYIASEKEGDGANGELDLATVVPVIVEGEHPWNVTAIGNPVVVRGVAMAQGIIEMGLIMEQTGDATKQYQATEVVQAALADPDGKSTKLGLDKIVVHGRVVSVEEEGEGAVPDMAVIVEGHEGRNAKLFFGQKSMAIYHLKDVKPGDPISVLGHSAYLSANDEFPFWLSACERFIPNAFPEMKPQQDQTE